MRGYPIIHVTKRDDIEKAIILMKSGVGVGTTFDSEELKEEFLKRIEELYTQGVR